MDEDNLLEAETAEAENAESEIIEEGITEAEIKEAEIKEAKIKEAEITEADCTEKIPVILETAEENITENPDGDHISEEPADRQALLSESENPEEPAEFPEESAQRSGEPERHLNLQQPEKHRRSLWFLPLMIIMIPVALVLIVAILAIGLAAILAIGALALLFLIVTTALLVSGAICLYFGAKELLVVLNAGLLLVGVGFMAVAVSILLLWLSVVFLSKAIPAIGRLLSKALSDIVLTWIGGRS